MPLCQINRSRRLCALALAVSPAVGSSLSSIRCSLKIRRSRSRRTRSTWTKCFARPGRANCGNRGMPHEIFQEPEDATPLTPEEQTDLIPAHIAYRAELNAAEQENIARGQDWALARKRDLLSEKFIKHLHRHMFADVWRWAGKFRITERNLGI